MAEKIRGSTNIGGGMDRRRTGIAGGPALAVDLCEVDDDDGYLSKLWRDRLARDLRLPGFVEGLEMVAKDRRGLNDGKLMTARQNLQRL